MDKIKKTNMGNTEVIWISTNQFDEKGDPRAFYTGYNPHTEVLPKGWQKRPDRCKLPCDIVFEQDVAIEMRDGVHLMADIYRPNDDGRYPVIVSWSPYGKNGSGFEASMDIEGVDMMTLSGLQKFEGVDPARWVNDGYVVINVDSRGSYMSEGDVHFWGTSEGRDAYDATEWIAQQSWCSGKVAFAGNSWLAVHQWFTAAEQPPHLTCIAPWEGHTDLFGDDMCRGGIPNPAFNNMVVAQTPGRGFIEHAPAMLAKYPYYNEFWSDKRPAFDKITCPAYIVASYNSPCHVRGSFEGFRKIASEDKWFRVHNTQEWPDFYAYQDDLKKFFDHYMKDVDNGWENTPKVRISVIDPGGEDVVDQPETSFPLERQQFVKLYIGSDGTLSENLPEQETVYSYNANDKTAEMVFTYKFEEDTDFIGYSKLRLYVSAEHSNDMDVNVAIDKLSVDGEPLVQGGVGRYTGPTGKVRASRRKLDESVSTESEPILLLDNDMQFLGENEIVQLDVPIWPTGLRFHKGESLRIVIKPDLPPMLPPPTEGTLGGPEEKVSAGTAEEAFAMGMDAAGMPPMPGMPPMGDGASVMPPMGGMPPMGDGAPGMPPMPGVPPMGEGAPGMPPMPGMPLMGEGEMFNAGEFGMDLSNLPPAKMVPTPPRPGGTHKFYTGGKYQSYLYLPLVKD